MIQKNIKGFKLITDKYVDTFDKTVGYFLHGS